MDKKWMRHCIELAKKAELLGEVPVGAVIVKDDELVSEGWNQPIINHDPTAHAEIVAIRSAAQILQNYRIPNTTLYVSLEPCAMCAGAIIHARIERIVFGAYDPKGGAAGSVFEIVGTNKLNHTIEFSGGLLEQECSDMLKSFFKKRR